MTTKTVLYSVLAAGAATFLSICDLCQSPAQAATTKGAAQSISQTATSVAVSAYTQRSKIVTLDVQGMTCGGCVIGVQTVLKRLPGVTKAEVRYETHRASVTYDPAKVTITQMIAAIETLKYTATPVAPAKG